MHFAGQPRGQLLSTQLGISSCVTLCTPIFSLSPVLLIARQLLFVLRDLLSLISTDPFELSQISLHLGIIGRVSLQKITTERANCLITLLQVTIHCLDPALGHANLICHLCDCPIRVVLIAEARAFDFAPFTPAQDHCAGR